MIGTAEDRTHLDRMQRERIWKRHNMLAAIECIQSKIEAYSREALLAERPDTDALLAEISRDLKALQSRVND